MLLEALIAILVFSLGILTVIGIQAASIKLAADAQLRTKAALLANQLVGQMWTSGADANALATRFNSPSGADYATWRDQVADVENLGLPGVSEDAGTLPMVAVVTTPGRDEGQVRIEIFWRTPSMEDTDDPHHYTVISQISRN
jgi:type IV pilus assembly protein PilV